MFTLEQSIARDRNVQLHDQRKLRFTELLRERILMLVLGTCVRMRMDKMPLNQDNIVVLVMGVRFYRPKGLKDEY